MIRLRVQILAVAMLFAAVVDAMPPDSALRQDLSLGRDVFLTYCSGCHGFNGLAFYPPAPSFAMNDRLGKSDPELMNSILKGKGAMPWWEGKLPRFWLEQALAYVRHVAQTEDFSIPGDWDGSYYKFSPVGTTPNADWPIP